MWTQLKRRKSLSYASSIPRGICQRVTITLSPRHTAIIQETSFSFDERGVHRGTLMRSGDAALFPLWIIRPE